jgi:hypothetical protein
VQFDTTPTAPGPGLPIATPAPEQVVTVDGGDQQQPSGLPRANLTVETPGDEIREALLDSHMRWETLWLDGTIIENFPAGGTQQQRVQVWVDRPGGRFRVISGPYEGQPEQMQVSDGTYQERVTLGDMSIQRQELGALARDAAWTAPRDVTDTIYPHPLDQEMDNRFGELIFPAGLAQRGGVYAAEGEETVAGRAAIYAAWSWENQMRERLWIDAQTGVILRADSYGKETNGGGPVSTVVVNDIRYDAALPDALFALQLEERPRFALDATGAVEEQPAPQTGYTPGAGSLYFVVDRSPDTLALARLPGNCVTGGDPCPAPEIVAGFPNQAGNIHPLVWSPDGSAAALSTDGAVWLYTPESEAWKSLAMFPVIIGDPLWSPDGSWVVFVIQNEAGQDIYAVRPDGSELTNLTVGAFPYAEQLWLEGWLESGELFFSLAQNLTSTPYRMVLAEGGVMNQVSDPIPSGVMDVDPSGRLWMYSEQQEGQMALNSAAFGEIAKRLFSFGQASIADIHFSPVRGNLAEQWVAFMVIGGGMDSTNFTIYAMHADGSDMRQLFQSASIQLFSWSADGEHIIVQGTDNGRLTVVSLDGQVKVVEAPGMRLDQRLLGASWRK